MSRIISVTIRRRLFMIFDKGFPYQLQYNYKLKSPKTSISHIQVLPGPFPMCIPILKTQFTDRSYHRFDSLIAAARYAKKLRNGQIQAP